MQTRFLPILLILLLIANAACFGLMAYDKHCARRGKWRIPERWLFLSAACFGALGGVLAMQLLRHKTRHWKFKVFFPLLLAIQAIVLVLGIWKI